jgi:hypothetical protein
VTIVSDDCTVIIITRSLNDTSSSVINNTREMLQTFTIIMTIGLHHPLYGVTNPEYKLLLFFHTTNIFLQKDEGTSF